MLHDNDDINSLTWNSPDSTSVMSHTAKSISLSPNSSISTGPITPAETPQSRCYLFVILENTNSFLCYFWVFALQRWGNIFNQLGHSLNWREVTLIFFYHVLRNVFFHNTIKFIYLTYFIGTLNDGSLYLAYPKGQRSSLDKHKCELKPDGLVM